jgi:hypothetical protein
LVLSLFHCPSSSWFPCSSPSPWGFVELASINAWVFLLLLVLSQKLKRLVNVWCWSPPTVGSWWITYMLGLWTCLWLLLLLNLFLSFGFCFICSLGLGFLFFPFAGMPSDIKNLYNLIIRSHLNSSQVDLNHKYGEVLHTYEVFVLVVWPTYQSNSSLFLMLSAGECQVCVIGNLCPETVEEAKAVVPSIAVRFWTCCLVFGFHSCVY